MGSSLKSYFTFYQSDKLTLNLGLYGILFYGDEDFLSDAKPLASYTFNLEDAFYFTMGYLYNENRHNMLDALQKETLEYTRQIDYGFQIRMKNKYAYLDLWMNWNLLNTPEHMEYLDGGINLYVYIYNFVLNLQRYWSHHGGQLYQVGPTTNNYSLALGLENYYNLKNRVFNKIGYKIYYLAYDEEGTLTELQGYGGLGELYFYIRNFKLYFDYWYGHNFITEEGDPLYQHKQWIFCGIRNESNISKRADFIFGFRMHYFIDTGISCAQARLELKSAFDYLIKDQKNIK